MIDVFAIAAGMQIGDDLRISCPLTAGTPTQ